ncbi:protein shisa-4 isoform X1 [Rhineura floridana]|uniref:protein shisa-4 isoform X1 n=1 Tax=Rhineura floridana TaxID=261503 RepID=UPI002AC8806F|nr:protein shisa-4 isoform X1 [Rhineura floridana]
MGAWALAAMALCSLAAATFADEDCKWYMDRNGSWHPGFDCNTPSFCCGDCYQRYCCFDLRKLLTERQQKHCIAFNPKTIAGIASAVILFVAIVATIFCCFLCSCCYLYQRRHHIQTPYQGQEIPLSSYPAQPPGPYPMDSKAGPAGPAPFHPGYTPVVSYPTVPAAQYPLYPPGPPYYNPTGINSIFYELFEPVGGDLKGDIWTLWSDQP